MHRLSPAKAEAGLAGAAAAGGEMGGPNAGCEGRESDREPSSADVFKAIVSRIVGEEGRQMQQASETTRDLYREGADFAAASAAANGKGILDDSHVGRGDGSPEGGDDFDAMVDLVVGDSDENDVRTRQHDKAHELPRRGGIFDNGELRRVEPMSSDEWDSFVRNLQRLGGGTDGPNYGTGPATTPTATMTIANGGYEGVDGSSQRAIVTTKLVIPHENDVLFGRGHITMCHPGNVHFRLVVERRKADFKAAKHKQKRGMAEGIIDEIQGLDPPGRFLMEDTSSTAGGRNNDYVRDNSGLEGVSEDGMLWQEKSEIHPDILSKRWVVVDYEKATVKVMHRLREKERSPAGVASSANAEAALVKATACGEKGGSNVCGKSRKITQKKKKGKKQPCARNEKDLECSTRDSKKPEVPTSTKPGGHEGHLAAAEACPPALLPNDLLSVQPVENGTSAPEVASSNIVPSKQPQLMRNIVDPKGKEKSDSRDLTESDVPQYKYGDLDLDVDSFLQDFSSLHGNNNRIHTQLDQQVQEKIRAHGITLREWMEKSRSRTKSRLGEYVRMALPVALKVTKGLMEGEPLANISVENILVRLKSSHRDGEEQDIDDVLFTSNLGNSPDIGTIAARLLALGKVLYELFSGTEPPACANIPLMIDSVNLDGNHLNQDGPLIKKRASDLSDGWVRLEGLGLPYSLRALVKNLLDYGKGDLCGDDTYTSLADVRTDLLLMMNDPICFLDDIATNPLPSLVICNKLYGREREVATLERCHGQHISYQSCNSIFITGEGGVGKSNLAMHLRELSNRANGYFLMAKFDQNMNSIYPMATIASIFNSLCDLFARDSSPAQLSMVNELLTNALGSGPAFLAGMLPSLSKIMPSSTRLSPSVNCIDPAMTLQFQFGQLLSAISSQSSRPITMLFDDLHWADSLSLMLIGSLIADNERSNSSVLLTFCYRNEEVRNNEPLQQLLESVSGTSVEMIKLDNMDVDGVNSLLSDSLHVSPRLTRPLAWVLYHKTRGNPLFLRQLLESLTQQGCIYVDLKGPRWQWDMDQITDLQISDDVVAFLIKEMQRLPAELQLASRFVRAWGNTSNLL